MKIKAKTLFGELVTIVQIEVSSDDDVFDLAVVVDKEGNITVRRINTLTVIDEEYLPKEGEG